MTPSGTGARLTLEGSVDGSFPKEFFLLLSSIGLAYRRCELAWVNDQQIGVRFVTEAIRGFLPRHRFKHSPKSVRSSNRATAVRRLAEPGLKVKR
jgi:hypothetical protein